MTYLPEEDDLSQQVEATITITYDADAKLSKRALRNQVYNDVARLLDADSESRIEAVRFNIDRIREEAEIYGNET